MSFSVAGDVHGVDGVECGFSGEEPVHIQIGSDQTADDGTICKDVLYVKGHRSHRALNDLFTAVNGLVRHIVVGHLLESRDDVAFRIN